MPSGTLHCLECTSELLQHNAKVKRGEIVEGTEPPRVNEAWTLAPAWQQTAIMGQMVMACVAVPACMKHMQIREMSPADKAMMGGKILPGKVGGN